MQNIKKFILAIAVAASLCACDNNTSKSEAKTQEIAADKIYYFYQETCPHCHHALEYINKKHPNLEMVKVNIAQPGAYDMFVKCVRKFNLGSRVGTPLFCMGDNYLMGWSPDSETMFDQYAQPFIK